MSADQPTVQIQSDQTTLAVTLGRIEEKQNHMSSTLDEVRGDVKSMAGKVGEHDVKLAEHDEHFKRQDDRFNEFEKTIATLQPIKVHWTAIAAFIAAVGAIGVTVVTSVIK